MGLVDYASSSSDDDAQRTRAPPKRRKRDAKDDTQSESIMPPLPATFHDLYASSVRQSVADDPSLHQGRKRQNPHVAGNWPTHVYVEWHPSKPQHDTLVALVEKSQRQIGPDVRLHNFLNSDLGTEQPLHISLSKPLSLPSPDKDDFLINVKDSVQSGEVMPFSVKPVGLAWYKSPGSDRSFFVLRVVSTAAGTTNKDHDRKQPLMQATNPELMKLLVRCNKIAASLEQPTLYQQTQSEPAHTAFHVSIGWTMGSPDHEICLEVLKNFRQSAFHEIRDWRIPVDAVKVKIGNFVSHIPLTTGGRKCRDDVTSLFGSS